MVHDDFGVRGPVTALKPHREPAIHEYLETLPALDQHVAIMPGSQSALPESGVKPPHSKIRSEFGWISTCA